MYMTKELEEQQARSSLQISTHLSIFIYLFISSPDPQNETLLAEFFSTNLAPKK